MQKMQFPTHFINVVYECINSSTFSILLQGIPKGFITSNRGHRQEDHLSPYLFTIAVEYSHI